MGLAVAPAGCGHGQVSSDPTAGEDVAQVAEAINVTSVWLRPKRGGKCVEFSNGTNVDATQAQTWTCDGVNWKKWHVTDVGSGRHQIKNVHTNKCLWVLDGNNARWVEQRTCNSGDWKQLWYFNDKGNHEFEIKNAGTNTCMDLAGGNTSNAAKIQAWSCNNGWNQRYHLHVEWMTDFWDGFDGTSLNTANWRDQLVWVNSEDMCYLPNGDHNTRSVGNGMLTLRLKNLGYDVNCNNWDKTGRKHPNTRYVAGRIASKNRKEFVKGKWTARLRLWAYNNGWQASSGQSGMFPAWWLLGERNNESPVDDPYWENVCWPLTGSGEVDIFEHHGDNGSNKFTLRGVKSKGYCDGGDWQTYQVTAYTGLNGSGAPGPWHEYAVEWVGRDMYYTVDDNLVAHQTIGNDYPEKLFAVLNYAKINTAYMTGEWGMDVDYVKHEYH